MDKLEKYIPLLIIAASFIVSMVSSARKAKKREEQAPPVPPVRKRADVPASNNEIRKHTRIVPPEEIEPVYSSLSDSQLNPVSIGTEPILLESSETTNTLDLNIQDIDEVRKAFIYSEILKRQYE